MNWQRKAFDDAIACIQDEMQRGWVGLKEGAEAVHTLKMMRPQQESDRAWFGFFDGADRELSVYPNGRPAVKVRYSVETNLLGLAIYAMGGASIHTCYSMGPVESIENFAARVILESRSLGYRTHAITVTNNPVPSRPVASRAEMSVLCVPLVDNTLIVYQPHDRALNWWSANGVQIRYDDSMMEI